jgi:6-phosphogluconolactonase
VTLWVGTYEEQGGSGLYPLVGMDPLVVAEPVEAITNASFAAWSPLHRLAYFVDERADGRVGAWRHDIGGWSPAGTCPSGGSMPCYVSASHDGSWLAIANYENGSVGLIALNSTTGQPERLSDIYQATGSGLDAERQDGPHSHSVVFSPDDTALYHADLGTDRIYRHAIGSSGFTDTTVAFQAPAGHGPRHLLLLAGGERALLICELGARLLLLRCEGERFVCLDDVPTAPEPSEGNLGGHLGLGPDASIYVTNRGHDSLVRFTIEGDKLVRGDWWPTGGSSPRHFVIDGAAAIVAHEEDGGVTRLNLQSGVVSRAKIPAAAFLIDIPD